MKHLAHLSTTIKIKMFILTSKKKSLPCQLKHMNVLFDFSSFVLVWHWSLAARTPIDALFTLRFLFDLREHKRQNLLHLLDTHICEHLSYTHTIWVKHQEHLVKKKKEKKLQWMRKFITTYVNQKNKINNIELEQRWAHLFQIFFSYKPRDLKVHVNKCVHVCLQTCVFSPFLDSNSMHDDGVGDFDLLLHDGGVPDSGSFYGSLICYLAQSSNHTVWSHLWAEPKH